MKKSLFIEHTWMSLVILPGLITLIAYYVLHTVFFQFVTNEWVDSCSMTISVISGLVLYLYIVVKGMRNT